MTRSFRSSRAGAGAGVFALMNEAGAAARAAGLAVVDLSVGTPDLPPPPEAIDALRAAVDDPETYKYCLRGATMPLLRAACEWYQRHYGGPPFDAATEAISLVGSQEGLTHLLMAVAEPGDGVLMCGIGYACYRPALTVASLVPLDLPLRPDGSFLPDFAAAAAAAPAWQARPRALLLNYPQNPTAAVADDAFWDEALAFAEAHDLLLIHDNPYAAQVYGGTGLATSPLSRPNARGRCVELFSFSKSYQLGGFRLGFALGNADAIAALEAVKAPVDFNQYLGIQRMGIACLALPDSRTREYAAVFEARAAALVAALKEHAGWAAPMPKACMYLWTKLPPGYTDDAAFCLALVAATGIALAPGSGFGPGGAGCVRFALVREVPVLRAAARAIGGFLESPAAAALRAKGGAAAVEAVEVAAAVEAA